MFMTALQRLYDVRRGAGGWRRCRGVEEVQGGDSVYLPGITDTSQTPLLRDNTFMDDTLGSFHGRGG